MKQPVSVLVVIHTPTLEVVLMERATHPGYWQSVTGSREGDESLLETAQREVLEETGISTSPGEILPWHISNRFEIFAEWRHRYAQGTTHNLEHVFSLCVAKTTVVRVAPGEHLGYCWLPWREAGQQCFSWSNRDAILMLPHLIR